MEPVLQDIPNSLTDAGAIRRFVDNLYQGWGYNAYRKENQLRADDLLVRGKVSEYLSAMRRFWSEKEQAFRRENLPPPSRENPTPSAEAIQQAQGMQRIQKALEALEAKIRTAPAPENDRVWQRHRNEADTLTRLLECDKALLEAVVAEASAMRYGGSDVAEALARIESLWEQRQALLFG